MVTILTDESFADALGEHEKVVVDFYADWCPPCKMFAPIFEDVAESPAAGSVFFAKLNVDNSQETAMKYGVKSIPTIILFANGAVANSNVGTLSKQELVQFISG
ncbi:MAG: thioredoxin [Bifidobacteriaceae bacterium]|jgi:thioredoxin 1|nr:thioredoxin [Bifidobacteriaceae bacterium]